MPIRSSSYSLRIRNIDSYLAEELIQLGDQRQKHLTIGKVLLYKQMERALNL